MAAKHSKKTAKKNIWLKLLLCISLIASVTATTIGTHAWLYHEPTAEVVTLTGHNLVITASDKTGIDLIPGNSITYTADTKPYVRVNSSTSVNCYVFMKIVDMSTYFDYSIDTAIWTACADAGYYYKEVTANTSANQNFDVLTNDKITVKTGVTLTQASANRVWRYYACAVQRVGGITYAQAYALAKPVLDAS